MAKSKLSKSERRKRNTQRRIDNKNKLEQQKKDLAYNLNLGGEWSTLELLICAAAKFDFVVDGSQHPNGQIGKAHRLMKQSEQPKKLRCKTMKDFYSSRAWKILRYQALEKYGNRCQCCGATSEDGLTMRVDHIKPKSTHPELSLDLNNLQILCIDCNVGKINQWDTDWRP